MARNKVRNRVVGRKPASRKTAKNKRRRERGKIMRIWNYYGELMDKYIQRKMAQPSYVDMMFGTAQMRFCLYLPKGTSYYRPAPLITHNGILPHWVKPRVYCDCDSEPIYFNNEEEAYDFLRIPFQLTF